MASWTSEVAILDAEGRIVAVNETWMEVARQVPTIQDSGVGAPYIDAVVRLFPGFDRSALEKALMRLLSSGSGEVHLTRARSSTPIGKVWRDLQIGPLIFGKTCRFVAVHTNQNELVETRQALQAASQQIVSAQDDERRRIAMELHDSTCQHLVAIDFGVSQLRQIEPEISGTLLDEIARSSKEANREIRLLSFLLTPRDLDQEQGLSTSAHQFLDGFARRTGLKVSFATSGPLEDVPLLLQHAALRIMQEALLNADRHARACRINVALRVAKDLLTISVADDGQGMRSMQSDARLGVGIPGMRARAEQVLGNLTISSRKNGTKIVAQLPLT